MLLLLELSNAIDPLELFCEEPFDDERSRTDRARCEGVAEGLVVGTRVVSGNEDDWQCSQLLVRAFGVQLFRPLLFGSCSTSLKSTPRFLSIFASAGGGSLGPCAEGSSSDGPPP